MIMHGHGLGIVFAGLHLIAAGGFFYLLWHISRSLRRIANRLENQ
jgi:hypothetical protein